MSRELERRIAALERSVMGAGTRYVVSERPLTDQEWHATKNGHALRFDEPDELEPLLTEAEWVARFCF